MKKLKSIWTILVLLVLAPLAYGQSIYHIFGIKNWAPYFKLPGIEVSEFYYSCSGLKDSLPDGTYFFYSFEKSDSLKKEYSREIISATFLGGRKNGLFKSVEYRYNKKKKKYEEVNVTKMEYLNGVLCGNIEEYHIQNYELYTAYIMYYFCEYKEGTKNGLEIHYQNGYPYEILLFEDGVLKQTLMQRKITPDQNEQIALPAIKAQ